MSPPYRIPSIQVQKFRQDPLPASFEEADGLGISSKIYHGEQHVTPNMGNQIHLAINYNHS